jgi:hypothetical protein
MLIGIMQHASGERGEFSPFEYQCQLLQRCDVLPKINTRSTLENVLETLRTFKQEWHRHQQFLIPFDFSRSTGLCPDVVIEITKYLSLNETITACSIDILRLLRDAHSKVHLNNPSKRFLQIIPEHLDTRQIVSLHITDDIDSPACDFLALQMFDQVVSVTVLSQRAKQTIGRLLPHFPRVRRLSLWFGDEFDSVLLEDLRGLSFYSITRLHIRCPGVSSSWLWSEYDRGDHSKNKTITSFILDSTYYQVNWNKRYSSFGSPPLLFFKLPMPFIKSLSNVRRIRLVVNRDQLEMCLLVDQWQQLISECPQLERVIIQSPDSEKFTQTTLNIEQTLRLSRPEMIFRIKSV